MRQDLPMGTVTFLFTDVEGSTRLLESLGPNQYTEALLAHRRVVRSALADHSGAEVDTQGDAFFCAFASASSAVACAQEIQAHLAATPIRVRMGIHTGEALVAGDHYVGLDVHRAARIGACGHGGQVVLSPSTVALVEPGAFPLRDLGEHRLKDLSAPVRLYQLDGGEFPPLKTLFRTDLPVVATEFLGREAELAEACEHALEPNVRLLTLTGPGGTGKTRFALQLAGEIGDEFPDGVRWVPLASLRDPALVAATVAEALDVDELPDEALPPAVARALGGKRILLLIDNCEHVLDAVAELVAALLGASPYLLVLATSREPLAIAGEHVYPVQPLATHDAVRLFETRATAAGASLAAAADGPAVQALCARLDNLPLAVELAAARAAALPPAAMLTLLSERLALLKGPRDADERHRTLRSTIAWSYDLLDPDEKRLFRRLATFVGGAPLESVAPVCEGDVDELLSLVAKSLVRQESRDGAARYWMLETIREFAVALPDEQESALCRNRHLAWFAALARDSRDHLEGAGSTPVLDRLEQDRENLRAALAWALERTQNDAAQALASVLGALHALHGRYGESEDVLRTALSFAPSAIEAALLESQLGRVLQHRGRWRESLETHLRAEQTLGAAPTDDAPAWWEAWLDVKLAQAHHYYYVGDVDALAAVIEAVEPEAERRGKPRQSLELMHVMAEAAYRRERYVLSDATEELVREIHRRAIATGEVDADFSLGFCLLWRGKLEEAQRYLRRGRAAAGRRGDTLIEVRCLVYESVLCRKQGDVEAVRALLGELEAIDELHGYVGLFAANRAWLALRDGDLEAAARFGDAALADWDARLRSAGPTIFQWTARFPLLAVELERGRVEAALNHARAMLDPRQQPLPDELAALLTRALERSEPSPLERALERARAMGHA